MLRANGLAAAARSRLTWHAPYAACADVGTDGMTALRISQTAIGSRPDNVGESASRPRPVSEDFCMDAAAAALIAASTSVVVTVLSLLVGDRQQRRREARTQRQDLNSRYLNPLRLHLVENYYRLTDVLQAADLAGGVYESMLSIEEPEQISGKDAAWFNGTGCALASSVYLSACLFAQLKKVRDDFPYLRLSSADDTRLAAFLLRVQQGYLLNLGVFYVTQPSIGQSMWADGGDRLLTYREFCERLRDASWRVWLDRLIQFHLDTARGTHRDRSDKLLTAIRQLSDFLDDCVGGGNSIRGRQEAEGGGLL
jgi:hypothetical protein